MCPIEAYQGGTEYLGETGTGYSEIKNPNFTIYWSGDDSATATVTDGKGYVDQAILPLPGDSMVATLPTKAEIVIYRK